jgi:Holliday junction resolvasome RuvABC endonuclease subunit
VHNDPPTCMKLHVLGQDPSLRHWGLAKGVYDTEEDQLVITQLSVTEPSLSTGKQVRQNSLDLESARQLCEASITAAQGVQVIFVEVPVGSQSARAMASYGICIGVLGSLRATGIPLFEVSPLEVKKAGHGKVSASKLEMIQWAMQKHPEANWPTYKQKGEHIISTSKAEHQADAVAAIYAGLASNQFKQLLPLLEASIRKESCKSS